MATPRKNIVSLDDTPFYHCISRCVRKAFLCGTDPQSGESYEHRRNWVEDRLLALASVFAIDICAYAVMSNHLHVVLRVDEDKQIGWSDREVVEQWHQLFKGTLLTQRYAKGDKLKKYELKAVMGCIKTYRLRLVDISWFMRALNEPIARQANKEDQCTGRFWEGRFKSQALLDEAAVLACMVYVDLNPLRAKMAKTPETSAFTSIQRRITAARLGTQPQALLPFTGDENNAKAQGLNFHLQDYLTLVDDTGRIIRQGKRGFIAPSSEKILDRLNITADNWLSITQSFMPMFKGPVGALDLLSCYAQSRGRIRRQGVGSCEQWL